MFALCYSLTTVTIPSSITTVGYQAFTNLPAAFDVDGTVYHRTTEAGFPLETNVQASQTMSLHTVYINNNVIGTKSFHAKGNELIWGNMETRPSDFIGLGIIEDALQIETALSLGIRNIPRESLPEATLYHTKMGYLPIQKL